MRALVRAARDCTGNLPTFPRPFPDQMVPIVRNGSDERELVMARWGIAWGEGGRVGLGQLSTYNSPAHGVKVWPVGRH